MLNGFHLKVDLAGLNGGGPFVVINQALPSFSSQSSLIDWTTLDLVRERSGGGLPWSRVEGTLNSS
ncbi:hypothetical protein PGTUg99_036045 [Puccinia graminis f. sp. tritici]|uniref:Uncharacterized protein n=1 Tax=Puccinia graminis f. sp. tritici TaxID=56615 RepID=A0A5B0S9B4_PUCGR|nr:hypothetical protein PGTUg99_036045 [Puccinia graminis f. sp. tritici]